MTVFESVARRVLRREIAQRIGDLIVEGTATAGAATTMTDTVNLLFTDNTDLVGAFVFIHTGTGIGQERPVTAFTASSDQVTVPTWTTNPDSTSQYEIHRRHPVAEYNRAIDAALRASRLLQVSAIHDRSLLTQTPLLNPVFTNWANGASLAPDSWTLVTAGLQQTLNIFDHANSPVAIRAVVASVSALTRLSVSDGVGSAQTDSHAGTGGWEELLIEYTPSGTSSSLQIDLEINTTGSASIARNADRRLRGPYSAAVTRNSLVAYFDSVHVSIGRNIYEHTLPANIHSIHRLAIESPHYPSADPELGGGEYTVPHRFWFGHHGTVSPTTTIGFRQEHYVPPSNRLITIEGTRYPSMPSADTSEILANVEAVVLYAAYTLLDAEGRTNEAASKLAAYKLIEGDTRISYPPNSRIIGPAQ